MTDDVTDDALAARLQWVIDRAEIDDLIVRYATAVDTRDWELLDRVFADGAEIDYRPNGGPIASYPAMVELLAASLEPFAATQHVMTNMAIDVQGDDATVRFYRVGHMVLLIDGAEEMLDEGGFYDLVVHRTPAGWRITSLRAGIVWLSGHWPEGVPRPAWYGVSSDRY